MNKNVNSVFKNYFFLNEAFSEHHCGWVLRVRWLRGNYCPDASTTRRGLVVKRLD